MKARAGCEPDASGFTLCRLVPRNWIRRRSNIPAIGFFGDFPGAIGRCDGNWQQNNIEDQCRRNNAGKDLSRTHEVRQREPIERRVDRDVIQ